MKIYKILMLLTVVLSVVSCSDLEEDPSLSQLSSDGIFASASDLELGVNAAYLHALNEEIWGRKLSISLMLRSDMVNLNSTQTRRVEMNDHTITDQNEMVYDPWKRIHRGIAAANAVIDGAEVAEGDQETIQKSVAEARFIKAWYYFHLVRLFGDVPYIEKSLTAEDIDNIANTTSLPEAEVYERIIADLEFAETWLPDVADSRARPSKAAAKSYLALVYLTMAETSNQQYFQLAYNKAKEVIDNKGTYNVDLDPDFQALFDAERVDASSEPIFVLDYNNLEAADNAYDQVAPMTGIRGDQFLYTTDEDDNDGGWSVAQPTLAVYNSFDVDDYRTRVSFQTEAQIGGTIVDFTNFTISGHGDARNQPYIAKYLRYPGAYDRGSRRATSHNYSMMRYAEVLLIAAEAGAEIGAGDALSLLNEVRGRARNGGDSTNGGYTPETISASAIPADLTSISVEAVLEERRIELAFEGKRWYDIKRRQLGDQVFSASGYEGAKAGWDASTDYDTPLPADELAVLPNLNN